MTLFDKLLPINCAFTLNEFISEFLAYFTTGVNLQMFLEGELKVNLPGMDKKPEVSKPKPQLFKTLKKIKKLKRSQYVIGFMSDFPPEFLWLDGQIETDFIIYVEKSLILCGIDIVKNSQKTYHVLVYNSGLSFRCFLWWWHIKRLISSLLILLIA